MPLVASAVSWAISVAAYQSYILAGLGLLWMVARERHNIWPWLMTSALVGTVLFVSAALGFGAGNFREILGYLTTKPDGEYWGFIQPAAVLQLPFGLANAFTPPWPVTRDWPGLRLGWAGLNGIEKTLTAGVVVATLGLTLAVAALRVPTSQRRTKWGLLLIFLAGLFAPFYLLPYYNKLWLMPLGALGLAAALVANAYRPGWAVLMVVLALLMFRNTQQIYFQKTNIDNPANRGAVALEDSLTDKDLLITDDWEASGIYSARNPGRSIFRLVNTPVSAEELATHIEETRQSGGRVLVFGLLELSLEKFALSDISKRGRIGWVDIIKSYQPQAKLIWRGQDHGVIGDLYELVD